MAAQALGGGAGGAGAEEGVQDDIAGVGRSQQDAIEQRFRFLCWMGFLPV